jgi:hypothetical protein
MAGNQESPGQLMTALVTGGLVTARGSELQTMDALGVSREEGQQHVATVVFNNVYRYDST